MFCRSMLVALTLLGFVAVSPAHAAQALCPAGQVWTCNGGIDGVRCWCENSSIEECLIFDLSGSSLGRPPGSSFDIVARSRIESAACEVSFELAVERFDGERTELIPIGSVLLDAEHPDKLIPFNQGDLTGTGVSIETGVTRLVYDRMTGKGEAHQCTAREFLSVEVVMATRDENGRLQSQTSQRPRFTRIVDEHAPKRSVGLPAITPGNLFPPGFWNGQGADAD